MRSARDDALRLIQRLPDDCTVEQIQYHLYVLDCVRQGLEDLDAGRVFSQEEAERRVEAWL